MQTHSVMIMNPSGNPCKRNANNKKRRSTARKGATTLKSRKKRKRRNPANPAANASRPRKRRAATSTRRVRRNPSNPIMRRRRRVRRNPGQLAARAKMLGAGIKPAIIEASGIIAGIAVARGISNAFLSGMSAYMRGAAQAAIGLVGGMLAESVVPAKYRAVAKTGITAGGFVAGGLTILDEMTGKKYRPYYNLQGYRRGMGATETYFIPRRGAAIGSYTSPSSPKVISMGAYSRMGEDGNPGLAVATRAGGRFASRY